MKKMLMTIAIAASVLTCHAGEIVLTAGDKAANYGFNFDNGQEFPGATGKMSVDADGSLKIEGDFTKGGAYVTVMKKVEGDISEISFQVKFPDSKFIVFRAVDSGGQAHQFKLKLTPSADWQTVTFNMSSYLADKAKSPEASKVMKYEPMGGAKDGTWHGPAKKFCFYLNKGNLESKLPVAWFKDVKLISK